MSHRLGKKEAISVFIVPQLRFIKENALCSVPDVQYQNYDKQLKTDERPNTDCR
jgi:hypothetical protein